MKTFILILSVLIFASCGSSSHDEPQGEIKKVGVTDSSHTIKDNVSTNETKPFSNPALIYGSDFGNFFQTLYIQGDYETMLAFTSSESIELHGEDAILQHYKNMEFGFNIGKPKKLYNGDFGQTLVYSADINATKVVLNLDVVIENDSCKVVVYQDLDDFPNVLQKNF